MAEGSDRSVSMMKEGLMCSICLDTYTDPKLLQCHHAFCKKCLVGLVVKTKHRKRIITCPACRRVTVVSDGGVAKLPTDFHSNLLKEILSTAKTAPTKTPPIKTPPAKTVLEKTAPARVGASYCSTHRGTELEFFCETCGTLICCRCAVRGGQHYNHNYKGIEEAFAAYKQEVVATMAPLEKNLTAVNSALTKLEDRRKEICKQQAEIRDRINITALRLKASIEAEKLKLIAQLYQATEKKLANLTAQVDRVSIVQAQFSSILDSMKNSLQTKSHGEVLTMQKDQIRGAKDHLLKFPLNTLKPVAEANMLFMSSPDTCVMKGQVCEICATGKGLHTAEVGKESVVNIDVVGDDDNLSKLLQCELVSDTSPPGSLVRGVVGYNGRGSHQVRYTPAARGLHHLHIKVQSRHISGSPYRVVATDEAGVEGEGEMASSQGGRSQGGGLSLRGLVGSVFGWHKTDESSV